MNKLYFAKLKQDVIIPSKREEDGGYDFYANFEEDEIIIKAHHTMLIPTKLLCAFSSDYVLVLRERGSNGVKGIGQRAGIIDSGYRNEIFVPLTNHNDKRLIISKKVDRVIDNINEIVYPYSKAICQALLVEVPKVEVVEITPEELKGIKSERGEGKLGSSGK